MGTCTGAGSGKKSSTDSSDEGLNTLSSENSSMVIYPNPASTYSKIEFNLVKGSKYTVELYSLSGTLIEVLSKGTIKGSSSIAFDLDVQKYVKGTYIVRVVSDKESISKRIIVQ